MQSDDLFIRKFRRQSPRPPLAAVSFEPKRDPGVRARVVVAEWPPRKEDGAPEGPAAGLSGLRSSGRGHVHVMQRSNSDVTLGDLEASGKAGGLGPHAGGGENPPGGPAAQGDPGAVLHREYGSLSSLEKQSRPRATSAEEQGVLSPSALRFRDPLVLLGLQAPPPAAAAAPSETDGFFRALSAPGGEPPKPPPRAAKPEPPNKRAKSQPSSPVPPQAPLPGDGGSGGGQPGGGWVRNFAHYDVQSILFDLTEAASNRDSIGRKKNITSGASAASQQRGPAPPAPPSPLPGAAGEDPESLRETLVLDEGDGNDNDLLLSCPHFRNEIGGEERAGLGRARGPGRCPDDAVSVLEEPRESHVRQQGKSMYFVEHADLGAHYYRKYFYMKDHQNFFGTDERLGPVAISFRREEKEGSSGAQYNYRIIFRTTELKTLRGSILEESVLSAARHTTPRGLSPKKLLEFIIPELNLHSIRLASTSPKVRETLLKLDEQGLNFQRKVGVLYCRSHQSTEEDMYNNESAGPAFEEFLDLLGDRVRLKGFEKYRAQLDTKTDSTGTHSLYTRYQDYEIMFHVSTMLPYTANNTQQLLRKRHIGNDIVTIIFQEPGAHPFTPKTIRSHFQHVFIIVRAHYPCTDHTYYRVAVTRSKDIPLFGPLFPQGARFPKSPAFRDFLLAKAVNAENGADKSEKFRSMATRTRQEYLKDLAENYVTTTPIDSSTKFPLLSLGGKRKEKLKGSKGAEMHSAGALVWAAGARPGGGEGDWVPCLLGISAESVVLIERGSRQVVFNCSCRDVIGWSGGRGGAGGGPGGGASLDIFYERGEAVSVSMPESQGEEMKEVIQRLELVTRGCEAQELTPLRDSVGQLDFRLSEDGFVTELRPFSYAESSGLQVGARVARLCDRLLVSLPPQERLQLLRAATKIRLTVIPPDENGKPRRSYSELYLRAIQDTDRKAEGVLGEAWVLGDAEREEGDGDDGVEPDGPGEGRRGGGGGGQDLAPPSLSLHRATSLQDSPRPGPAELPGMTRSLSLEKHPPGQLDSCDRHFYDNVGVQAEPEQAAVYENIPGLLDTTPDLILAVTPKTGLDEDHEKQFLGVEHSEDAPSASNAPQSLSLLDSLDSVERSLRTLDLRNPITEIQSETTEEEWQYISDVESTCRSILETLSREGHRAGDGAQATPDCPAGPGPGPEPTDSKTKEGTESDSPAPLVEKVSQLEAMLKRLQDDLQKFPNSQRAELLNSPGELSLTRRGSSPSSSEPGRDGGEEGL
ncbi:signal-induced proliferation-associated protein 1 isoform X2 [Lepisosteus oculatus]|uniref:signal-induced proliferation-associated protein 1 isoform X2 n=1 Tax=Lepisosteus oculatus TaxID=7918 RepID=UPI0035F52145